MRYLIARGPDGQGVVAGARTLREAKTIAEGVGNPVTAPTIYIIDSRTGRTRPVRIKPRKGGTG